METEEADSLLVLEAEEAEEAVSEEDQALVEEIEVDLDSEVVIELVLEEASEVEIAVDLEEDINSKEVINNRVENFNNSKEDTKEIKLEEKEKYVRIKFI